MNFSPLTSLVLTPLLFLSGCSQNAEPNLDLDYEKRLIEYEFCLDSTKEKWDNLLGTAGEFNDLAYQNALKECEGLRP